MEIPGEVGPSLPRASLARKLIHLAMMILPAAGWSGLYGLAVALAGTLAGVSLLVETARRLWSWPNQVLWRLLPTVFRESEDRRMLGSTWFAVGALASFALLGRDIGGTAVLFLCWGDPAAEWVGVRWGRAGKGKTVVGSLTCLLVCTLAGLVGMWRGGVSLLAALVGALIATLVERWPPPPDDNLWMPVVSGLAMALVLGLIGGDTVLLALWR